MKTQVAIIGGGPSGLLLSQTRRATPDGVVFDEAEDVALHDLRGQATPGVGRRAVRRAAARGLTACG